MGRAGVVAAISTVLFLIISVGGPALAQTEDDVTNGAAAGTTSDGITVEAVWSRPSAAVDGVAVAYMTLRNGGDVADALISGSSPAAAFVELHQTAQDAEGMMSMSPVESIVVPAQGETVLEPGGYHLMLVGLHEPLAEGDSIDLMLLFQEAGVIEVSSMVMAMDAGGPMDGMDGMDGMDAMDGSHAHGAEPVADPTASFPAEAVDDD